MGRFDCIYTLLCYLYLQLRDVLLVILFLVKDY